MKNTYGKIILINDDINEKHILELALYQKNWDIMVDHYTNAEDALMHLKTWKKDEIFLIISDMNMHGMNGLDFKKAIDNDNELCKKEIPFIVASTIPFIYESFIATQKQVIEVNNNQIKECFNRPLTLDERIEMISTIINYWVIKKLPKPDSKKNSFKHFNNLINEEGYLFTDYKNKLLLN